MDSVGLIEMVVDVLTDARPPLVGSATDNF